MTSYYGARDPVLPAKKVTVEFPGDLLQEIDDFIKWWNDNFPTEKLDVSKVIRRAVKNYFVLVSLDALARD